MITPRKITVCDFEYLLDDANRVSAVLSTSTGIFQIPNQAGLTPGILNADGTPLDGKRADNYCMQRSMRINANSITLPCSLAAFAGRV